MLPLYQILLTFKLIWVLIELDEFVYIHNGVNLLLVWGLSNVAVQIVVTSIILSQTPAIWKWDM